MHVNLCVEEAVTAKSLTREEVERLLSGDATNHGSLQNAMLAGVDLSHLDLSKQDLSSTNLSAANLSHSNLSNANLSRAQLHDTVFFGTDLSGAEFIGADAEGANFSGCDASRAGFGATNLGSASFFESTLSGASFSQARLRDADLRCADMQGARLHGCDMEEIDASGANLQGAELDESRVDGASFDGADLRGGRMKGVSGFEGASFLDTDIRDTDFRGAYAIRRWIIDENYLHEFRTRSPRAEWLYKLWWLTSDCGRSFWRWGAWTALMVALFAAGYAFVTVDYGDYETPLSPIYFSVVTLTTLGFGDVVPSSMAAQVLAMIEVVVGYVALGGLLSILANKMGRRGE